MTRTFDTDRFYESEFVEHRAVAEATQRALKAEFVRLLAQAIATIRNGGKIMFFGNGGSASDAQHFAAELVGRFLEHREPYAAVALTADAAVLTCIGNDYAFDDVFARQVAGLGRAGDLLVAISTSGESENVVRAARQARHGGLRVLGLTGRTGGRLAAECDVAIVVPSASTARIQEAHILVIHTLCELVEHRLRQDRPAPT
jgi:D-sedoheptulose 7-phosphate isomerase